MNFKRFIIAFGAIVLVTVMVLSIGCQNQPTAPQEIAKDTEQVTANPKIRGYQSGSNGGYFWSLWTSDGLSGSVNYSNGSDGNYSVSWNCNGNFTCGKGWSSGSTNRIVGYNCGSYSQSGGGGSFAYYGWCRNPLMEYYVNEKWPGSRPTGNRVGSVSSDGGNYDIYESWRSNAPSIDGTQSFRQIYSTRTSQNSTGSNHTITFANHANAWRNAGYGLGSDMSPAAILLTEAWGQSSGNCNATVWSAGSGGGSTSTTTTTSGYTTTTTSGGGGGSNSIVVRARGTNGSEHINLTVGGSQIGSWTLSTSMRNYSASTNNTGGINVVFDNDGTNRDVQVDYITVNGSTRQAENQGTNTAVWQNGSCGGSNSEWMHCNGYIGFGDVSGGGGGGGSTSTTTTSGGGGGGGNITYNLRARSTDGQGQVNLRIDNNTIATWTLGSSMSTYNASSYNTGGINVEFYNDATNRDVQIDYLSVNGSARQAENQSTNTGVWQNGSCGGSNSEWLHCNGYIGFGNTP